MPGMTFFATHDGKHVAIMVTCGVQVCHSQIADNGMVRYEAMSGDVTEAFLYPGPKGFAIHWIRLIFPP